MPFGDIAQGNDGIRTRILREKITYNRRLGDSTAKQKAEQVCSRGGYFMMVTLSHRLG